MRSTSAPIHDALRRALAAHLVQPEDDPAPPNFSLHVADDGATGAENFHLLYRGITAVVRTRDVRRLVDALLGYLSAAVERPDERTFRLDVLALVADDGAAVLVPGSIRSSLPSIERRLNAKGLRVVDRPWATVDVRAGELLVGEPRLTVDREALAGLPKGRGPERVRAGRYRVLGWGFGVGQDVQGPISRALALTLAGPRLLDRAVLDPEAALHGLAGLLGGIRPQGLWADSAEGLVAPVAALCRPTGAH